jgi:DNA topoisomerase-1
MDHAVEAGLRYVSDESPGNRRVRRGRGFSYHRPNGDLITEGRVIDRISALAIPPAWTDVWICTDPRGHLQATGRDARGRKQYRYHPGWRSVRDADKFDSLLDFGLRLPKLRKRVEADLTQRGHPSTKVLAVVVGLLDDTLIRIGNREYARDNDTYGLTTLRPDHVTVNGRSALFEFVGKGGVEWRIPLTDRALVKAVRACQELGGQHLFTYLDDDGDPLAVDSDDVNAYLREIAGTDTTAKDFRTWGATTVAAAELAAADPPDDERETEATILAAIDVAAERLGNTRTVCRTAYVHPTIPEAHRLGLIPATWKQVRATKWMTRPERLTLRLLEAGTGTAPRPR